MSPELITNRYLNRSTKTLAIRWLVLIDIVIHMTLLCFQSFPGDPPGQELNPGLQT